jgi:hypothetical protein
LPEIFSGETLNLNFAGGPVSITLFLDMNTGEVIGGTIGYGKIFSPIQFGVSGTYSNTGVITIRRIIDYAKGFWK